MAQPSVAILGAGRMGQGLALALGGAGTRSLWSPRSSRPVIPPLRLHGGPREEAASRRLGRRAGRPGRARSLRSPRSSPPKAASSRATSVLHLSGLRDRGALGPLAATGAGLGSFHPLQTVSDPATAAARFAGAYAGIEGDDRALAAAEALAKSLRHDSRADSAGAKPAYHAGAAFAANYTIALVAVAERLALAAGIPRTWRGGSTSL